MKAAIVFHLAIGLLITVSCLTLLPRQALALDNGYTEASDTYSREELAQMLAPIALYPDALLTQVLMASTYPIEVVEADRWVSKNPGLKGETLDTALLDKDWSPSVKAVCHFPSILTLMSERLTETTNLGNAFLAQEAEVLDMVQELRAKAHAQGNLTTNAQQKVVVEKETIVIQPADSRVIYVPYYDPLTIYGRWWYPAYPPYYWGPSGVRIHVGISYWPGFYFGFVFGNWSSFDWHRHYIFIDVNRRPRFIRHDRWPTRPGRWDHNPMHRRGVAYYNKATAQRYGQSPRSSRDYRHDTRGFPERSDRTRTRTRTRVAPTTRIGERSATTPTTRLEEQTRVAPLSTQTETDRVQQNRQRLERDRKERSSIERDQQQRQQAEQQRQRRERVERDLKERARVQPSQQQRQRAEQDRPMRERAQRQQQERARVETVRQPRPQQQIDQQMGQQRTDQPQRARQQVDRGQAVQPSRVPGQTSDSVFNRIDNGSLERRSSERGRFSRQGESEDNSRGRGQSNRRSDQNGRDNRGDQDGRDNRGQGNRR